VDLAMPLNRQRRTFNLCRTSVLMGRVWIKAAYARHRFRRGPRQPSTSSPTASGQDDPRLDTLTDGNVKIRNCAVHSSGVRRT
jgi:hypothetical protein